MNKVSRFTTPSEVMSAGIQESTLHHASLDTMIPNTIAKGYRGPLPSTNTFVDSAVNFYVQRIYKNQRVFQPDLSGSLG